MIAAFSTIAFLAIVAPETCRSQFPVSAPGSARAYFYKFDPVFVGVSQRRNVDPALLKAIAWCESRFDPCASSGVAHGLMQFTGSTFSLVAPAAEATNPYDPIDSVESAGVYLATLLNHWQGDVVAVVASYNAGPAAVHRARSRGVAVPEIAETQDYVACVLPALGKFRTQLRVTPTEQRTPPLWHKLITAVFPPEQSL